MERPKDKSSAFKSMQLLQNVCLTRTFVISTLVQYDVLILVPRCFLRSNCAELQAVPDALLLKAEQSMVQPSEVLVTEPFSAGNEKVPQ